MPHLFAPEHLKLTERQQQVFQLIIDAMENTGSPPTRAEIAIQLGFRSANAAEDHLKALARKGVIELVGGTSRGIRVASRWLPNRSESSDSAELLVLAPQHRDLLSLPLLGRVAAGRPMGAQEHIEHLYSVDATLFSARPDYLLKVRGMSMRDAGIVDGDLLAVQQTKTAHNGQIVVARVGDEVTVKRFRRQGPRIELIPENPEFKTLTIHDNESFTIEGLAVGLVRNGLNF